MSMRWRQTSGSLALADVAAPPTVLDRLSLDELRLYRRRLAEEEEKISYWRRLVHARIDVLEAEAHHERPLRLDELIRVLGDTGTGRTRTALVNVRAADDLPELPVLARHVGHRARPQRHRRGRRGGPAGCATPSTS